MEQRFNRHIFQELKKEIPLQQEQKSTKPKYVRISVVNIEQSSALRQNKKNYFMPYQLKAKLIQYVPHGTAIIFRSSEHLSKSGHWLGVCDG